MEVISLVGSACAHFGPPSVIAGQGCDNVAQDLFDPSEQLQSQALIGRSKSLLSMLQL